MVSVDLIIFDLDGTLVDSTLDIAQTTNYVLQQLNLSPLPVEQIRSFVGDGITRLVERSLETQTRVTPELLNRALQLYYAHHEQHLTDFTRPFPGVVETLQFFHQKKKVVVSNKAERFSRKVLQNLKLQHFFDLILGGDSLSVKKPNPEVIHYVLKKTQVNPQQAIIVGDGPQDIQCGLSAGIYTCGVTYGFRPLEELKGAYFLINAIAELQKIIQ